MEAAGGERGVVNESVFWELVPVFAAGGVLLWFLVRSLLRYRGWWSAALSGRTGRTKSGGR
jgi:hypothetical protein